MKKTLFILMLVALTAIGMAENRTGAIRSGYTMLSMPLTFSTSDSIIASATYTVTITNIQKYLQHQTFTTTLSTVSGSPNVTITAYGKVTSGGAWVQIGDPVTWTSSSNNPVTITSAAPLNYNYLKVAYVASGTTQHSKVTSFEVRTANVFNIGSASAYVLGVATGTMAITSSDWAIGATGNMTNIGTIAADGRITGTGGATLTGAATNINASSNFATNINTGSTNAALTLGGGSGTVAVNSSVWGITTAGVASGLTGITTSGVTTTGSIVVAQDTCKGMQTKAVGNLGVLRVTAACTLNGLSGGVAGQLLRILNTSNTTLVLKHNGTGTQKFMLSGAGDLTMTGQYNAVTLTYDGTNWYVTGKGQ